ncbi:MAG: acyltransferase family protein, partial [Pseudomonadota bacterium]
ALALRGLVVAIDRKGVLRARVVDPVVRFLMTSQSAPLLLGAPLVAALYFKPDWMMWFGVPTPDTGLFPPLPSLVAFSIAFGFGWLLHRQTDLLRVWEKSWLLNLGSAVILTAVCLALIGPTPVITPEPMGWRKLAFAICYVLGLWSWVAAAIGAAMRFLSARNCAVRYVSDASYWIYIVHLPIVMALQILVWPLNWPWEAKYALILCGTLSAALLTYQIMVRYTFIGAILNGRKTRPRKAAAQAVLAAAE